jgi:hypothetical protein
VTNLSVVASCDVGEVPVTLFKVSQVSVVLFDLVSQHPVFYLSKSAIHST